MVSLHEKIKMALEQHPNPPQVPSLFIIPPLQPRTLEPPPSASKLARFFADDLESAAHSL